VWLITTKSPTASVGPATKIMAMDHRKYKRKPKPRHVTRRLSEKKVAISRDSTNALFKKAQEKFKEELAAVQGLHGEERETRLPRI